MTRADAGFETMNTYIHRRHNTIAQYIANQLLLELCELAERNYGERVGMQWWEQAGIDLAGSGETAAAAAEAEEDGLEN